MFDKPRDFDDAVRTLVELSRSFQAPATLAAAVELGVFDSLRSGAKSAERLAKELRCSTRGTRILCDALGAMQILRKRGPRYELLSVWKPLLDPESSRYAGGRFAHARQSLLRWSRLAEAVKKGKPVEEFESEKGATHAFSHLVPALFSINWPDAVRAMKLLGVQRARSTYRVLDLAAGSGVWGIAAAKANRRVESTEVDFSKILSITRQFAKQEKVSRQLRYLAGDIRALEFKANHYDLIILGLVAHQFSEHENQKLFHKLAAAIRPGGKILIVEFAPYDDRSGPPYPVIFALNMLLSTHGGDAFSRGQYCDWLDFAGFTRLRIHDMNSGLSLIEAKKPI